MTPVHDPLPEKPESAWDALIEGVYIVGFAGAAIGAASVAYLGRWWPDALVFAVGAVAFYALWWDRRRQ